MFKPNLDLGGEWVAVDSYTVDRDRFNHQHKIDLDMRADALIVNLTSEAIQDTWKIGGDIYQTWLFDKEIYQTAADKIRLKNKQIIAIEPLAKSTLIFIPVGWLYNWKIEVWAREYQPQDKDFLQKILLNQQVILDKLDNISGDKAAQEKARKQKFFLVN